MRLPNDRMLVLAAVQPGGELEAILRTRPPAIMVSYIRLDKAAAWWHDVQLDWRPYTYLDSGAFTLNSKDAGDVDAYFDRYLTYCAQHRERWDWIVELDVVKADPKTLARYRSRLRQAVGDRYLPVWHHRDGLDAWLSLIAEFPYVGIGGIVRSRALTPHLGRLLEAARKRGTKVHGFGMLPWSMARFAFDTVDTTAWLDGPRFGSWRVLGASVVYGRSKLSGGGAAPRFEALVRDLGYDPAVLLTRGLKGAKCEIAIKLLQLYRIPPYPMPKQQGVLTE